MDKTMPVDTQDFKDTLAKWAGGVTVVTTMNTSGSPHGMTISSFTSVSLNPMLILICVNKRYYGHQVITENGFFAVNILNAEQVEWGKLFAGFYPDVQDRFAEIAYTTAVTGAPILPGVIGWVDCRIYQMHEAGDHTIFVGEVQAVGSSPMLEPLLYFNRNWGHFSPHSQEG